MAGKSQVLVTGAGPAGLFAAYCLARSGNKVEIVDTGIWACSHSYALALHPQTVSLFDRVGLGDQIRSASHQIRRLRLFDREKCRASVQLDTLNGEPMLVLPQDALEAALERALRAHNVAVEWRHQVSDVQAKPDSVSVVVNQYEKESRGYVVARTEWVIRRSELKQAAYLIGADGYNSAVRRALSIDFPETGPATYYAVFEFESDAGSGDDVCVVLGENTTDVLWRLGNGRCRWGFQLTDYRDPEEERLTEYRQMFDIPSKRTKDRLPVATLASGVDWTVDDLRRFLKERAPWFSGTIGELDWRTTVRFERRLVPRYGSGRTWLIGDAAHLAHPIGVQSLNLGLFEANQLAEAVSSADAPSSLKLYGEHWLSEWRTLQGLGGDEVRLCEGADPWLAAYKDRLPALLPAHGSAHRSLASQLGLSIQSAA
jgi:2-polyprenyl-6-methoxyphenol hydroxylase-like FAD-dependent oxidoreductase